MKWWRWLTTPDPDPGFTGPKLLKLLTRVMLFALVATLLSSLLQLTPLGPYLNTWWGSLLFVLALTIPKSVPLSTLARPPNKDLRGVCFLLAFRDTLPNTVVRHPRHW